MSEENIQEGSPSQSWLLYTPREQELAICWSVRLFPCQRQYHPDCHTQLSKTQAVRSILDWAAPKIYGSSVESDPKSYNAVIIEDVRSLTPRSPNP